MSVVGISLPEDDLILATPGHSCSACCLRHNNCAECHENPFPINDTRLNFHYLLSCGHDGESADCDCHCACQCGNCRRQLAVLQFDPESIRIGELEPRGGSLTGDVEFQMFGPDLVAGGTFERTEQLDLWIKPEGNDWTVPVYRDWLDEEALSAVGKHVRAQMTPELLELFVCRSRR